MLETYIYEDTVKQQMKFQVNIKTRSGWICNYNMNFKTKSLKATGWKQSSEHKRCCLL